MLQKGIPRLLYKGNGELVQHELHNKKCSLSCKGLFYAAVATQFFAYLFHHILCFPKSDRVKEGYGGKHASSDTSPTFHEYWDLYLSRSQASSPGLKPPHHSPTGSKYAHGDGDDDDFEPDAFDEYAEPLTSNAKKPQEHLDNDDLESSDLGTFPSISASDAKKIEHQRKLLAQFAQDDPVPVPNTCL